MVVEKRDFAPNRRCHIYSASIETDWNGTLLKRKICTEEDAKKDEGAFPAKFAFPKQIVAKINRCLANNFFEELWDGPRYMAWHRTEEGAAVYIGTLGCEVRRYQVRRYQDWLAGLLKSPCGDAAVILLAFTCFSVLKSFFPQYHTLCRATPYLKAKKYLPDQLAVNVRSDQPEFAKKLVEFCCGFFQSEKSERIPIVDGVSVQKIPQKETTLGINEFENKVLQPASVLWVNRKPVKELTDDFRVIDLWVPANADIGATMPFCADMVAQLTSYVCQWTTNLYGDWLLANWKSAIPFIAEMQRAFLKSAYYQNFSFDDDVRAKLEDNLSIEAGCSSSPDPQRYIQILYGKVCLDVYEVQVEAWSPDWQLCLEDLQKQLKKIYSVCKRSIREAISQNTSEEFSFTGLWESERNRMKDTLQAEETVLQKFAFLSASLRVFVQHCLLGGNEWINKKLDYALATVHMQQSTTWSAASVLEHYVTRAILDGRCARIRGERSDRPEICVWYDPRDNHFLLPSASYFEAVKPFLVAQSVTKRNFEQKLVDEGTLITAYRGSQARRTFEVKVGAGSPKLSVLKVRGAVFSKKFFSSAKVRAKLETMQAEDSSFRTKAIPL